MLIRNLILSDAIDAIDSRVEVIFVLKRLCFVNIPEEIAGFFVYLAAKLEQTTCGLRNINGETPIALLVNPIHILRINID